MSEAGKIKPWMLAVVLVAFAFAVLDVDPVGGWLEKAFGKGADVWAVILILLGLLIYALIKKK